MRKRPKRGRYRKYTYALKKEAVELSLKLGDAMQASKIMNVPLKNLRRWIENGPRRKKGGRKTHDPQMEIRLHNWITTYKTTYKQLPSRKEIKKTALQYSHFPGKFKASKGWYEKFMLRHFSEKKKNKNIEDWEDMKKRMIQAVKKNSIKMEIKSEYNTQGEYKNDVSNVKVHEKLFSAWQDFLSGKNQNPINQLKTNVKNVLIKMIKKNQKAKPSKFMTRKNRIKGLSFLLDKDLLKSSLASEHSKLLISDEENIKEINPKLEVIKNDSNLLSDAFLNKSILKFEDTNLFCNDSNVQSSDKISINGLKKEYLMERNSNILRNLKSIGQGSEILEDTQKSNRSRFPMGINNLTESNEVKLETDTQKTKKLYSPKKLHQLKLEQQNVHGNQIQLVGLNFPQLNANYPKKYSGGSD